VNRLIAAVFLGVLVLSVAQFAYQLSRHQADGVTVLLNGITIVGALGAIYFAGVRGQR
jgi:hypothetical protein